MTVREVAPFGAPCWIDLMTGDVTKAREFYGELFGWTSESSGDEFGGYVNFFKDEVHIAGCMAKQDDAQPDVWSVYLAVADAQATTDAAETNGAIVHVPPMDVGPLGRMVFVSDPGGAMIGMWQPGEHKGFGLLDDPGTPSWFELHTRNFDGAIDFYTKVFGWTTEVGVNEPGFRYTILNIDDVQLAGVMDASGFLGDGAPDYWSVYLSVDDCEAALAKVVELGGAVVMPAEVTPYGTLAMASDPMGATFKLRTAP